MESEYMIKKNESTIFPYNRIYKKENDMIECQDGFVIWKGHSADIERKIQFINDKSILLQFHIITCTVMADNTASNSLK